MKRYLFLALLTIISAKALASEVELSEREAKASSTYLYPAGQHSKGSPKRRNSFLHASPLLDFDTKLDFKIGQAIFEKLWVFAPSSTTASDGLGPLYNARSCARCHTRNGRGTLDSPALFLRLSIPAETSEQLSAIKNGRIGAIPDPIYGSQLQTFASPGAEAEAQLSVSYEEKVIELSDNEFVSLQIPDYEIVDPNYGPIADNLMTSARIASSMIGLGLLEAINESDILSQADPDDDNNDGISGKANIVWDLESQSSVLGRFGWKAGQPNLSQQNSAAFSRDIGISTKLFPEHWGDCTSAQAKCRHQIHGNRTRYAPHEEQLEAPKKVMAALLLYTRNIAVPRRLNETETVKRGRQVFDQAGCAKCHTPSYLTSGHKHQESLNGQKIWPYTDLLLHDMGPALADDRPEFLANGREWRTPPLWGLGSNTQVNGGSFLLHDGRARSILEAIMWHGGEAEAAKLYVQTLPKSQRNELLTFLESL